MTYTCTLKKLNMELIISLTFCLVLIKHVLGGVPYTCSGADPGDRVKDYNNCHNYFICTGNDITQVPSVPCPPPYLCFSTDKDDGRNGDCSMNSNSCKISCNGAKCACQTQCVKQHDLIADPYDCSRHYYCKEDFDQNPIEEIPCSSDKPFFNGDECVGGDEKECCICQVPVECLTAGQFFPDPYDCHRFYECVIIGILHEIKGPWPCEQDGSFVNGACDESVKQCTDTCGSGKDCLDESEFTCPSKGYFARCQHTCHRSYFICDGLACAPTVGYCPTNHVFNTDPLDRRCVQPYECSPIP